MNNQTGSYDIIPASLKNYINNYGCHFNKKLCREASRRMYKEVDGRKEYIKPFTKDEVDNLLDMYGIKLNHNKLYDYVYIANMCKADFLGSSIKDNESLCKYIKDVIDDADAKDGFIFNRFYADTIYMNNPIEWDDML